MELREWQYINTPNSNTASASTTASSKTNKEKFKELTDYMSSHKSSLASKAEVTRLDDGGFTYEETWYSAALKRDFVSSVLVDYSRFNSSWGYKLYMDTALIKEAKGSGWEALLEELEKHFHVPKAGSTEYNSLTEWVEMKSSNNTSSKATKTNKEKFSELVSYMQKHKDSSVIFTSVNGPNDTGFEYEEQRAFTNGNEYNLSLEVECKSGDLFFIYLDMDGNRLVTKSAVGWEDLLLKIKTHFNVPKTGSPEHKSLTESFSSFADEFKLYENLF
jgi:hypothetical protein